jgi:uncharacterized membrane protein YjjP (DUF1212 family)
VILYEHVCGRSKMPGSGGYGRILCYIGHENHDVHKMIHRLAEKASKSLCRFA